MINLQWDDLDESVVNDACAISDFDRALQTIIRVIDPQDREDLDREVLHFYDVQVVRRWWYERAGLRERRRKLDEFLNYLFAISIEEWHDENIQYAVGA